MHDSKRVPDQNPLMYSLFTNMDFNTSMDNQLLNP